MLPRLETLLIITCPEFKRSAVYLMLHLDPTVHFVQYDDKERTDAWVKCPVSRFTVA